MAAHPPAILCLVFCILGTTLCPRGHATEYAEKRKQGVLVIYPPRREAEAKATLEILLRARSDVARRLELPEDTPASAELVPGQEEFDRIVGPKSHLRLLGVAYSPKGRIVINISKLTPDGINNLYETVAHEMVHIMLGRYEHDTGVQLPKWFHEGVACWLGRVLPVLPDDDRLRTAANQGALLPLYHLDDGFPGYGADTEMAYLESEDFIRFLVSRHGPDAITRLLRSFARHGTMRTAVPDAFGVDLLDEEAAWMGGLSDEYPFLWTLKRQFSVFTVAALLTIVSFLLYRRRRARILARWEQEQRAQDAAEAAKAQEPPTAAP
jgi:hypothetical protein